MSRALVLASKKDSFGPLTPKIALQCRVGCIIEVSCDHYGYHGKAQITSISDHTLSGCTYSLLLSTIEARILEIDKPHRHASNLKMALKWNEIVGLYK